jgi:D-threonate/D-erythronate kinase
MPHHLVIADDFTGAAEIAGIAHRFGLKARILREGALDFTADVTVIDTDTRSLDAAAAQAKLRRQLSAMPFREFDFIFKKTDSALRGPIRAEIETMLTLTGKSAALLVPNNPSRDRTISGGVYRIDGIPLHQTSFANDPEWPAATSDVTKITGIFASSPITIADSNTIADIDSLAASVSQRTHTLSAGGADFFEAILRQRGLNPKPATPVSFNPPTLFICGTTAPTAREMAERAGRIRIGVCPMPADDAIASWSSAISAVIHKCGCAVAHIDRALDPSPLTAQCLQEHMGNLVANVLDRHSIGTLFIDGGATASTVCKRMNWNVFEVVGELSPGVVTLRIVDRAAPLLTIKPGSYRWPEEIFESRFGGSEREFQL